MDGLVYMDNDFDWRIEEPVTPPPPTRPQRLRRSLRWLPVVLLLLVLGGAWWAADRAADRQRDAEHAAIQAMLDTARDACRAGDGRAFFANQARDPAWQAALLRPDLMTPYCAGLTVTRTAAAGDLISANLSWTDAGTTWQRLAFFSPAPPGMIQVPPPAASGGEPQQTVHTWGTLITTEADAGFTSAIGRHVDNLVATTCAATGCLSNRQPFTLTLRGDYRASVAPNEVAVPSPRLLALDEGGSPGPAFWDALDAAVIAQLTPATIRFAVPPLLQQVVAFEREAAAFMRLNPDITVEIVPLALPPETPAAELVAYDGAAYTPDAALIAAGLVRDLTDYAASDPAFAPGDFYEQAWQSAFWRARLWLVPLAGQMRVLFLDCAACENDALQPPSLRWTWAEMDATVAALRAAPRPSGTIPPVWTGEWALLDTTRDTLFSYAYSHQAACTGVVPARCERPLGPNEIAAALAWYQQTVAAGAMPDVAGVEPAERTRLMVNWQSGRRRAALWVDDPVNYEMQLQLGRVGVVPFPGSDRFDGNTPYWVHGAFISQSSPRPHAVWRWLVFLSGRPVIGPLRYVPARPSVAEAMNYWGVLPAPLGEAMRTAFPFARPVGLEDRFLFRREQLTAVMSGALSPGEAAQQPLDLNWFGAVRSSGLVAEDLRQE